MCVGYTPLAEKIWKWELGEMAQLVKYLLYKHEKLSFTVSHGNDHR